MTEPGPRYGKDFGQQLIEWRAWPSSRRPEEHPAVAPHTQEPPDLDFEILGEVSVHGTWTDKAKIQCNVCGTQRKFINKGYIACYADGWWYIVGPQCGSETHKGRVNTKINAHLLREAEFNADESLRRFMEDRLEWRAYLEAIEKATMTVYAVWKYMKVQDRFYEGLCTAIRDDGYLRVRNGTKWGRVTGGSFLLGNPIAKLRTMKQDLSFLLQPISREEMNAALVALHSNGQLAHASQQLREQVQTLRELDAQIRDAQQFVTTKNLLSLVDWALQRETWAPTRLILSVNGDQMSVPETMGEKRVHFVDLSPLRTFVASPPT